MRNMQRKFSPLHDIIQKRTMSANRKLMSDRPKFGKGNMGALDEVAYQISRLCDL